jgi:TonB family protein
MQRLWGIALFIALATHAGTQQTNPAALTPPANEESKRVTVYSVGPGVTAPELLPSSPIEIPSGKCKEKRVDTATLFVLVDAQGMPRSYYFIRPLGNNLDEALVGIVAADRFKPGTHGDSPAPVATSIEMGVESCIDRVKDKNGDTTSTSRLRSQPTQKLRPLPETLEALGLASDIAPAEHLETRAPMKIGRAITAPKPLFSPAARFSDQARRKRYQGICLLSLVVDAHGMPQDIKVVKPLDYGLDESALAAVNLYRFKPAMKNGEPVPVKINVEVNFRLY